MAPRGGRLVLLRLFGLGVLATAQHAADTPDPTGSVYQDTQGGGDFRQQWANDGKAAPGWEQERESWMRYFTFGQHYADKYSTPASRPGDASKGPDTGSSHDSSIDNDGSSFGADFHDAIDRADAEKVLAHIRANPGLPLNGTACGNSACTLRSVTALFGRREDEGFSIDATKRLLEGGANIFEKGLDLRQHAFGEVVKQGHVGLIGLFGEHAACPPRDTDTPAPMDGRDDTSGPIDTGHDTTPDEFDDIHGDMSGGAVPPSASPVSYVPSDLTRSPPHPVGPHASTAQSPADPGYDHGMDMDMGDAPDDLPPDPFEDQPDMVPPGFGAVARTSPEAAMQSVYDALGALQERLNTFCIAALAPKYHRWPEDPHWLVHESKNETLVNDMVRDGLCDAARGQKVVQSLDLAVGRMILALSSRCNLTVKWDNMDTKDPTTLHHAAYQGDGMLAKWLVESGASIDPRNSLGQTPLHLAALSGHRETIQALLDAAGSDEAREVIRSNQDYYGRTAADSAAEVFPGCCGPLHSALAPKGASGASPPPIGRPPTATGKVGRLVPGPGEWRQYVDGDPPLLGSGRCDIAEIEAADMTPVVFFRDFYSQRRPVVIRGGAKHWDISQGSQWTQDMFAAYDEVLGGASVSIGTIPYPEAYGSKDPSELTTLGEYLKYIADPETMELDAPKYMFAKTPRMLGLYSTLPELDTWFNGKPWHEGQFGPFTPNLLLRPEDVQLAIGCAGSGAPFHVHVDALNAAITGRKRWFMYNSTRLTVARLPVKKYVTDVLPRLDKSDMPMECIQYPGDVMYVPNLFSHSVLNLEDSVAVAQEFILTGWEK